MRNILRRESLAAVLAVLVAMLLLAPSAMAESGKRYALVIGNGNYAAVPALTNPVNDASDVGGALTKAGFEVTYGLDVGYKEFRSLLDQFAAKSKEGAAVVFFYAGHGFEFDKTNHLVPIDARLNDRAAIASETFSLNDIINAIEKPGRPAVMFIDACRNNPLPPGVRDTPGNEGLAEVDTGRDLFVAFAAEPHKTARSGLGRNSPFTQALITHLRRPGLSISDLMVDVRKDVYLTTEGAQLPWDQSSLRSQFYFIPTLSITESRSGTAATADTTERSTTVTDKQASDNAAADAASTAGPDHSADDAATTAEANDTATPDTSTASSDNAAKPDRKKPQSKRRTNNKTEKDHVFKKPAVPKTRKAAVKAARRPPVQQPSHGKRPAATQYSVGVWPVDSISKGRRVRQQTQFGELVCIFLDERNKISPYRLCNWR